MTTPPMAPMTAISYNLAEAKTKYAEYQRAARKHDKRAANLALSVLKHNAAEIQRNADLMRAEIKNWQ